MSSETSTNRATLPSDDTAAGFQAWHFFVLVAMGAATVGVMLSRHTEPVALLVLSLAIVAVSLVGIAAHRALLAFTSRSPIEPVALGTRRREALVADKQLVLRAIKELEFDHKMRKISDADFQRLAAPLRAKAIALMQDLDRASGTYRAKIDADLAARLGPATSGAPKFCPNCGTAWQSGAKFCTECGRAWGATA